MHSKTEKKLRSNKAADHCKEKDASAGGQESALSSSAGKSLMLSSGSTHPACRPAVSTAGAAGTWRKAGPCGYLANGRYYTGPLYRRS